MLDEIRKLIGEALGIASAEVIAAREGLLAEQASEDARYAATTALQHPEGSTTPLNEAYHRTQVRLAKVRKDAEKSLPQALAQLMTLQIATQRRDEAERHLTQAWKSGSAKLSDGLSEAARDFFRRLANHGVHPHYLKQHSNETVAIIADLLIWKAKDAKFNNPDNPWRALLGVYCTRKIDKPDSSGRKGASVSGAPENDRHIPGKGDYRFDEMVSAAWLLPPKGMASIVSEPVDPMAEYALPYPIAADKVAALRAFAEECVAEPNGNWLWALKRALNDDLWGHTAEEAIALVSAVPPDESGTPLSYFLDAAESSGLAAGHAAFREATIRRFMLTMATDPRWAWKREELALNS